MVKRHRQTDGIDVKYLPPLPYTVRLGNGSSSGGIWNNSSFGGPFYGLVGFPTDASIMDDIVGDTGYFHPVSQMSISSSIRGGLTIDWFSNQSEHWEIPSEEFPIPVKGPDDRIVYWDQWLSPVTPAMLSGWSLDALNKFQDQVPTALSLPNSLYELKDIKGLIPKIDRSLSKTASGNFLAFEFGVKPLISDVKAVVGMMDAVDKRIEHLLEVNGRSSNLSFKRVIDTSTDITDFSRNLLNPYSSGTWAIRFVRKSAKATFFVTGDLYQDLDDLKDSSARLKALLAAGGFNRPATVIWNAIPYSFVVDWFFSVGKLLDTMAVQPFGGTYDISNVGWSLKREAFWFAYLDIGDSTPYTERFLGTVTVKGYERHLGYPMTSLFLTDGSLSPKQQVLSLAMLEQRRR